MESGYWPPVPMAMNSSAVLMSVQGPTVCRLRPALPENTWKHSRSVVVFSTPAACHHLNKRPRRRCLIPAAAIILTNGLTGDDGEEEEGVGFLSILMTSSTSTMDCRIRGTLIGG